MGYLRQGITNYKGEREMINKKHLSLIKSLVPKRRKPSKTKTYFYEKREQEVRCFVKNENSYFHINNELYYIWIKHNEELEDGLYSLEQLSLKKPNKDHLFKIEEFAVSSRNDRWQEEVDGNIHSLRGHLKTVNTKQPNYPFVNYQYYGKEKALISFTSALFHKTSINLGTNNFSLTEESFYVLLKVVETYPYEKCFINIEDNFIYFKFIGQFEIEIRLEKSSKWANVIEFYNREICKERSLVSIGDGVESILKIVNRFRKYFKDDLFSECAFVFKDGNIKIELPIVCPVSEVELSNVYEGDNAFRFSLSVLKTAQEQIGLDSCYVGGERDTAFVRKGNSETFFMQMKSS